MMRDVEGVLQDALALTSEQRASLIDSLIESLDSEADPAAEQLWRQEVQLRLQQIDSGAVKLTPWEEARRRLKKQLER
jgi:putative addiction module component (TIGR02574 family)